MVAMIAVAVTATALAKALLATEICRAKTAQEISLKNVTKYDKICGLCGDVGIGLGF